MTLPVRVWRRLPFIRTRDYWLGYSSRFDIVILLIA